MSWFSDSFSLPSETYGRIEGRRRLGCWGITTWNRQAHGSHSQKIWSRLLPRIPREMPIKRILILGGAATLGIPSVQKRFPGSHFTVVEQDSAMREIIQTLRLVNATKMTEIATSTYDLVLVDQATTDFSALKPFTHRDTFLLVNAGPYAFRLSLMKRLVDILLFFIRPRKISQAQPKIMQDASRSFIQAETCSVDENLLAIYRPHGAGVLGDPLSADYQSFRSSAAYLRREATMLPSLHFVGSNACPGIQRRIGPFIFEKYYGDLEPALHRGGFPRLIIWQPVRRQDQPRGWKPSLFHVNAKTTGFVDLDIITDASEWSSHARRHLKHWLANQEEWIEEELTLEEFTQVYMRTTAPWLMRALTCDFLGKKKIGHGDLLKLRGYRRHMSTEIEAGFAVLDIPEISQSIHVTSFICDIVKDTPIGVGMVQRWFDHCRATHIRFADFDQFRGPGDPESWQGFSRFKAQFGTYFVRYPHSLMRWIL